MAFRTLRAAAWQARLRLRGRSHAYRKLIEAAEFASKEEVERIQEDRLRSILGWARDQVPYYADVFSQVGLTSAKGALELSRFAGLPLLTKGVIREAGQRLRSRTSLRKEYTNTSGGSTGEPVRFQQHADYQAWGEPVTRLFDRWSGYRLGDPKVVVWGSERDLFVGRERLNVSLGRAIRNETWLNAFRMGEADLARFVSSINHVRPVQVLAYVEAAVEIARYIKARGLSLHSPTSVMTSAGTLFPEQRREIEDAFGAPVFDRYGSREVGNVASQCGVGGNLHVCPVTHIVEILGEDDRPVKPGTIGRVVITVLMNRAMPFVRFEIGDLGIAGEGGCACGRNWPVLERIVGRSSAMIRTPTSVIDGAAISTLFYYADTAKRRPLTSIRRYQVRQSVRSEVELLVVTSDAELWKSEREALGAKFRTLLGPQVRLTITEVEDIPLSASGKFLFVVSTVT